VKRRLGDAAFARLREEVDRAAPDSNLRKADALRERLFPQQQAFIADPYRYKTLLCPRRAGKTHSAQAYLLDRCLRQPGASCVFITMTKGTAKRIIWGGLKALNDELELGAAFHNTELIMTLPDGGRIALGGAETSADIDKFRGVPFDLIVLDECKSFPAGLLQELVEEVLTPCLSDRLGTLVMMGTPGAILQGPFFAATGPESQVVRHEGERRCVTGRPYSQRTDPRWYGVDFMWSQHSWGVADNIAMPHIWADVLEAKRYRGWADDHPTWLREYIGQWVANDGALVYRYDEARNGWTPRSGSSVLARPDELPVDHEWRFIAGMDLGFDDDFSLQVAAYSDTCADFYHVYDYAEPGLTVPAIAEKIRDAMEIYGEFEAMVGDRGGLGKTILATLDEQYGLHVEPAEKQEKRDHIELLNADLASGQCKIIAGSGLAMEMQMLQWDERTGREDKDTPNHRADGFAYLWRFAYHHFARKKAAPPKFGSPAWEKRFDEDEARKAVERRRRERDLDDFGDVRLEGNSWSDLLGD
jgi:hypothetical protein